MKILLLTTHLNIGGISSYVVSLAEKLSAKGHKVFVASGGGYFEKRLEESSISHIKLPILTKCELHPKVIVSTIILLRVVRKEAIDVIHAQTRVAQVIAYIISKAAKIPYVVTCHGFFKPRLGRRILGAWGNKTIAISEAVREHLVNDFKVKKNDAVLIYNGIELGGFRDYSEEEKWDLRKRLGLEHGQIVGIIARLSIVKGHKYLILAMKEVMEHIPNTQLLIVGEGSIKNELVSLARQCGIEKNTHFINSVSNTAAYLSIMDVFVLPSLQEGLGLSIMEALAMKRGVVASNAGGIYSIIKNNITGLLVPPGDEKALADAIITLLKDRELSARLGSDGRKLMEQCFSLGLMIEKIEELYTGVIKDNEAV